MSQLQRKKNVFLFPWCPFLQQSYVWPLVRIFTSKRCNVILHTLSELDQICLGISFQITEPKLYKAFWKKWWLNFFYHYLLDVLLCCIGWWEVPGPLPQVPWPHLGLHNGLVPALAQRRPDCCGRPLPVLVQHRLHTGREEAGDTDDGYRTRRGGRELCRVLPEVSPI